VRPAGRGYGLNVSGREALRLARALRQRLGVLQRQRLDLLRVLGQLIGFAATPPSTAATIHAVYRIATPPVRQPHQTATGCGDLS